MSNLPGGQVHPAIPEQTYAAEEMCGMQLRLLLRSSGWPGLHGKQAGPLRD